MLETLVWDQKKSVRSVDANGYLHVSFTPISKATVNPYKGSELQGLTDEKLDPEKIYYGYRAPEELAKGAKTFNGLFLLDEHHNIDSVEIPREYIIGTVGTDAVFKNGYLYNSLTIADAEAIKNVKEETKWEISSAYRFTPVFKEGEVEMGGENIHYDFVMTNIKGNHVALVPEGRAGHEVRVADSKENVMDDKKQEKIPVCNADQMNMALDQIGVMTLEDFKARVNSDETYDIKVITEIKNTRGEVTAIVCGNKEHQFIVGYDSYGHIDAEELINDAMASKVREAVEIGRRAKTEEDNAKKAFKYDVQKAVEEQRNCPAHVPTMIDPIEHKEVVVGDPDCVAHEIVEHEQKPVVELVGDEAMQTEANAGAAPATNGKQSIVDESAAKGMGDNIKRDDDNAAQDALSFDEMKEALENTAYKSQDELIAEIRKWGANVGLTKVVSGGSKYSIQCTKGEMAFTVEYKQQTNCVEITAIKDDGQAAYAEGKEQGSVKGQEAPADEVKESDDAELGDDTAEDSADETAEDWDLGAKRCPNGRNVARNMANRAAGGAVKQKVNQQYGNFKQAAANIGVKKKKKVIGDAKPISRSIYELLVRVLNEPADEE